MPLFKYILSLAFAACLLQSIAQANRPNVILIVCDDLNADIEGFGGHPQTQTPNITRLMDSGMSFQQMHCTIPICAPSRSSFLTGIYPHTSNNFGMDNWQQNRVLSNSKSISRHFKDNGYYTLGTGKLMHHLARSEWSEFNEDADYGPYAFDGEEQVPHPMTPSPLRDDFGKIDGSFGPFVSLEGRDFGDGKSYSWQGGNWNNQYDFDFPVEGDRDLTADERNAQWAIDQLKKFAKNPGEKPFFLGVGFMRPHTPLIVSQRFFDQFPIDTLVLPEIKAGDADDTFLTKSRGGKDRGVQIFKSLVASYGGDRELALKSFTQAYLACVASVDELIGSILDVVDHTDLKDNTIIVLTSDHGWGTGPKDYVYKNSLWEESTHVPFVVRAPGVTQPGSECRQPVSLVDLYPTLIDLCGLSADTRRNDQGAVLDGFSLKPFMLDPDRNDWAGPEAALTAIHKWKDPDPAMQSYSLRSKDWRYIRYHTGDEELYSKGDDPHEWTNLATNPEYSATLASFRKQLGARLATASSVNTELPKDAGEDWKDVYFKKHPEADYNQDGTLTWPEYKQHKGDPSS